VRLVKVKMNEDARTQCKATGKKRRRAVTTAIGCSVIPGNAQKHSSEDVIHLGDTCLGRQKTAPRVEVHRSEVHKTLFKRRCNRVEMGTSYAKSI